jgi:cysteine sulfinate desulfinase/cysteine desulfurase-like protein
VTYLPVKADGLICMQEVTLLRRRATPLASFVVCIVQCCSHLPLPVPPACTQLEAAITPETSLVSVMAVNNEIGVLQPLKEIGELCRSRKVSVF